MKENGLSYFRSRHFTATTPRSGIPTDKRPVQMYLTGFLFFNPAFWAYSLLLSSTLFLNKAFFSDLKLSSASRISNNNMNLLIICYYGPSFDVLFVTLCQASDIGVILAVS
jgi:hypothetical protein